MKKSFLLVFVLLGFVSENVSGMDQAIYVPSEPVKRSREDDLDIMEHLPSIKKVKQEGDSLPYVRGGDLEEHAVTPSIDSLPLTNLDINDASIVFGINPNDTSENEIENEKILMFVEYFLTSDQGNQFLAIYKEDINAGLELVDSYLIKNNQIQKGVEGIDLYRLKAAVYYKAKNSGASKVMMSVMNTFFKKMWQKKFHLMGLILIIVGCDFVIFATTSANQVIVTGADILIERFLWYFAGTAGGVGLFMYTGVYTLGTTCLSLMGGLIKAVGEASVKGIKATGEAFSGGVKGLSELGEAVKEKALSKIKGSTITEVPID